MKKLRNLFVVALAVMLFACESENPEPEVVSNIKNGAFIVNEGNFGASNSSISFYSKDSMKMTNGLFNSLTGEDLGDVLQSMTVIDGNAYFVVNNSQKVVVMDLKSYDTQNITGLSYPRYVTEATNGKAYISNGNGFGQNWVYVLNTATNMIEDSISVGIGPETFFKDGDDMYVTCKGGWSVDSMVYVINTASNEVTDTIMVGDVPVEIEKDAWGNLWVLCNGRTMYDASWNVIGSVPGTLVQINPVSKSVIKTIQFSAPIAGFGTNNLAISNNGETLYINNWNIQAYDINTNTFSTLIPNAGWYGIDVDPATDNIWGSNSTDGIVEIYNKSGDKLVEHNVGAFPSGVYFVE